MQECNESVQELNDQFTARMSVMADSSSTAPPAVTSTTINATTSAATSATTSAATPNAQPVSTSFYDLYIFLCSIELYVTVRRST